MYLVGWDMTQSFFFLILDTSYLPATTRYTAEQRWDKQSSFFFVKRGSASTLTIPEVAKIIAWCLAFFFINSRKVIEFHQKLFDIFWDMHTIFSFNMLMRRIKLIDFSNVSSCWHFGHKFNWIILGSILSLSFSLSLRHPPNPTHTLRVMHTLLYSVCKYFLYSVFKIRSESGGKKSC